MSGACLETTVLKNVLASAGVTEYSEATLFGLAGGIGASYFTFSYPGVPPTMFLGMRHGLAGSKEFFEGAVSRIGCESTCMESSSEAAAEKQLLKVLEADRQAVLWVGEYRYYATHGLVDGGVSVSDKEPVRTITLEDLRKKRAGVKSFKNRMLVVERGKKAPNLRAAAVDAVAQTVRGMEEAPFKNFASNFGLTGLEKLSRLLIDEKDKQGWARLFPLGDGLNSALERIAQYVNEYGGGGAYRKLYASFLGEVGFDEVRQAYEGLAAKWTDFAANAYPSTASEAKDLLQSLQAKLNALIEGEAAALALLKKIR